MHAYAKYHQSVIKYLETGLKKEIADCMNSEVLTEKATPSQKKIWVLWWEGQEEMPELVKCCCESIKRKSGEYEVVVLSEENFAQYITFPDYINEKYRQGKISIVHMADLLRVYLLCEYGGVWLDATVFLSDNFPEEYLSLPFFSRKTDIINQKFASYGRWSGYFMATSHSHSVLFEFLKVAYQSFWRKHHIIIDYFLLDYFISIAYEKIPAVKKCIDSIPYNNVDNKKLSANINNPYSEKIWQEICKTTLLHKLSWKKKTHLYSDGKETFYKKLLNALLDKN